MPACFLACCGVAWSGVASVLRKAAPHPISTLRAERQRASVPFPLPRPSWREEGVEVPVASLAAATAVVCPCPGAAAAATPAVCTFLWCRNGELKLMQRCRFISAAAAPGGHSHSADRNAKISASATLRLGQSRATGAARDSGAELPATPCPAPPRRGKHSMWVK